MSAIINPMDMSGQRILVTGASSGIGRDTAVLLSELGADVILVGRNKGRLVETLGAMGPGNHHISAFDLRCHDETGNWMKKIAAERGLINGLVHSAGISEICAVRYLEIESVRNLLSINLMAAISLAKAFRIKGVRSKHAPAIVFLSSVASLGGAAGQSCYAASKAGLLGLSRALAVEFAREGIRVNSVVPGLVQTELAEGMEAILSEQQFAAIEAKHPLGIGDPRDVSHAIAFLLAETGKWITGSSLVVDGGYLAP